MAGAARVVLTAENHLVTGGLGAAVAEALAEAGPAARCAGSACADTFAEGAAGATTCSPSTACPPSRSWTPAWGALGQPGPPPAARPAAAEAGEYAPV